MKATHSPPPSLAACAPAATNSVCTVDTSGEVVFAERPLAVVQDSANCSRALVCAQCLRFVGSLGLQADLLTGVHTRTSILEEGACTTAPTFPNVDADAEHYSEMAPCVIPCGQVGGSNPKTCRALFK